MELSAVFPTTEIGNDPIAIRDYAQAVEAMGFTRIIAYDHVLGAEHGGREPALWGPYTENDAFHEPLVLFGYLAAVTRTVELMTGVIVLPQRQSALVAKQAAEVDVLSGGRMVLGVGTGWNYVEYESLGAEFRNRARRMDEQVDVLRRLFRERVVDFTGQYHRVDRAGILPPPVRDIPIWFGGSAEASMARAIRVGDGYTFGTAGDRIQKALDRLNEMLAEAGRDPSTFGTENILHAGKGFDTVVAEAAAWQAAGGQRVAVSTMWSSFLGADAPRCAGLDDHLTLLRSVKEAVAG